MRSHKFNLSIPSTGVSATQPYYANASTAGTPLAGIQPDAPLNLTLTADLPTNASGGGDAVVTVRASAVDELRFRVKGALPGSSIEVLVSEL